MVNYLSASVTPLPQTQAVDPSLYFYRDLVGQLTTYNIEYLGIAITVILFISGLFYYFNLRPLQDRINKQELETREMVKALEKNSRKQLGALMSEQLIRLKAVETKLKEDILESRSYARARIEDIKSEMLVNIDNAKIKIDKVEKYASYSIHLLELEFIWEGHYLWKSYKVYANELANLISCREKSLSYKIDFPGAKLWLDIVSDCLDNLGSDKVALEDSLSDLKRLNTMVSDISGFDKEKEQILSKITSLTQNE
jgi:hypothetical protein